MYKQNLRAFLNTNVVSLHFGTPNAFGDGEEEMIMKHFRVSKF